MNDITLPQATQNQWQYVYEATISIYDEYDHHLTNASDKDKFLFVIEQEKWQHAYTQTGLTHLLQGLWLPIAYYDNDIEKLLVGWDVKPTAKNIVNYYSVLAFRILQVLKVINNDIKLQKLLNK